MAKKISGSGFENVKKLILAPPRISPRLFQLKEGKLSPEFEGEILDICDALLTKMVDFSGDLTILQILLNPRILSCGAGTALFG